MVTEETSNWKTNTVNQPLGGGFDNEKKKKNPQLHTEERDRETNQLISYNIQCNLT